MTEPAGAFESARFTLPDAPDWRVETSRIGGSHWVTRIIGPGVDSEAYSYGSYSATGAVETHGKAIRTAEMLRLYRERQAAGKAAHSG
jgi:hypothetical protein